MSLSLECRSRAWSVARADLRTRAPAASGRSNKAVHHLEEAIARPAALPNQVWINSLQQIGSVTGLVVAPRVCLLGGLPEGMPDVVLEDIFERLLARQSFFAKAFPVVANQSRGVRNDPGFHDLNHEMNPIFVGI